MQCYVNILGTTGFLWMSGELQLPKNVKFLSQGTFCLKFFHITESEPERRLSYGLSELSAIYKLFVMSNKGVQRSIG